MDFASWVRELPGRLIGRVGHPKTTMRWRLTLLYGGLVLVSGAALLAITYVLVSFEVPLRDGGGFLVDQVHLLLLWSAVALGIMALVSMLVGWVIAGRVLAPLRAITSATRSISDTNLHQRLAIDGPRDELTELADTIDGLLERLEVAFDAQRRFVANASHELRTPLTTMRATLDVAAGKPEVPAQTQVLDAELREDLDDADRLVESFLTLARAQHGELGTRVSVSLAKLVDDALAARGKAIAAKQLDLRAALAPVCVTGSDTLLARMVDNVIENSVRHNQARGFVTVELELDGETARLIVETGGPVLDQERAQQLAQPFRRSGAERTGSQNGHGLGLSIVATVAAAHGGTLELHARPQGGLRVQITLPAARIAQPAPVLA